MEEVRGYVIASSWVSPSEREAYVEVPCYLCKKPTLIERFEVIMENKKEKSRVPYPDYLFPGWQVICAQCAYERA